jgi:hypothetical protein
MTDRCTACDTPLIWAVTPAGKRAPITAEATENGNVLVLQPRNLTEKLAVTLSGDSLELARKHGLPLHLNHFADCIAADDFKRPPTD